MYVVKKYITFEFGTNRFYSCIVWEDERHEENDKEDEKINSCVNC